MTQPSISVVLPTYNEGENIKRVINRCFKFLPQITSNFEVLVLNDGSTDQTEEILEQLVKKYLKLKVLEHKENKGVGEALKILYKNAQKDLIFTLPSDGQVRIDELPKLLPYLSQFDIVIGRRVKRKDPLIRSVLAFIYNLIIKILFGLKVKDIDSVKLYKKEIFHQIKIRTHSAFEETEILVKAQKKNFKIGEVPIIHFPRKFGIASGVKFKTILGVLRDLIWFYLSSRFYAHPRRKGNKFPI